LTVVTDVALIDYLKGNTRDDRIFFIASQDDASYSYVYARSHVAPGSYP